MKSVKILNPGRYSFRINTFLDIKDRIDEKSFRAIQSFHTPFYRTYFINDIIGDQVYHDIQQIGI